MIKTIKKLLFFLTPKERIKALWLIIMMMIMAFLDLIGIASILPFMSTITDPDVIKKNRFLKYIYEILDFSDTTSFLFFLGTVVLLTLIVSLTFKALTTYHQLRFNQIREYTISQRLIKIYLSQPYSWFLHKNSADVGNNLLKEVNQVVVGAMGPIMNIIAQTLLAIAMTTMVILLNPKLAFISAATLAITYGSIYYALKGYIFHIGSERLESSQKKHKTINEAFYGIKEVKVGRLEKVYFKLFSKPAKRFALINAKIQVLMQLPRYVIELVSFGGIILLLLYLMRQPGGFLSSLPLLILYCLAAYRLIPALQMIYANFLQLRSSIPSINLLYDDIVKFPT